MIEQQKEVHAGGGYNEVCAAALHPCHSHECSLTWPLQPTGDPGRPYVGGKVATDHRGDVRDAHLKG